MKRLSMDECSRECESPPVRGCGLKHATTA